MLHLNPPFARRSLYRVNMRAVQESRMSQQRPPGGGSAGGGGGSRRASSAKLPVAISHHRSRDAFAVERSKRSFFTQSGSLLLARPPLRSVHDKEVWNSLQLCTPTHALQLHHITPPVSAPAPAPPPPPQSTYTLVRARRRLHNANAVALRRRRCSRCSSPPWWRCCWSRRSSWARAC